MKRVAPGGPSRPGDGRRRLPWTFDATWAPLTASALMLVVGAVGLAADQPWLYPSLGPTAFMQAEYPGHRTSHLYNTIAGHFIGLGAGVLAVKALGAGDASSVIATHHLTAIRVWAAVIAEAATILGMLLLHASHPPANSTTLMFALGAFRPVPHDILAVVAGVLILAVIGEGIRHLRLRLRRAFAAPNGDAGRARTSERTGPLEEDHPSGGHGSQTTRKP